MIFGGRWSPPEAASTMLITLGFDATRGRIVGAVAASMMMSNLWVISTRLRGAGAA